ncbi:hypothetical protein Adeg_1291 [Ammonifex degensii KC4]|uniref:Uncharacterized protein n=1 Tax=Ammonifex degensii (strain DSM 10501 / KC4) TaxID=429009 RepID=C9R7X0_AMMDK|nr:hypothetical protein [Ammonifex degensii]ACX52399.1 hypothetical protein Adeg_1291 [Ammonifex degensii KC4]
MVRSFTGEEFTEKEIKARIRFDFRGAGRSGRLFFGGKNIEKAAEEAREQQAAYFRNIPFQGIKVENIDIGQEVYTVFDETLGTEVAYAPLEITVVADGVEDLVRLVFREEFRKIEILSPENVVLSKHELERVFYRIGEEVLRYRQKLEKKLEGR